MAFQNVVNQLTKREKSAKYEIVLQNLFFLNGNKNATLHIYELYSSHDLYLLPDCLLPQSAGILGQLQPHLVNQSINHCIKPINQSFSQITSIY